MGQKQLNVRVDEATLTRFEAAAFVRGISLPELVRPYLESLGDGFSEEQAVQTALRGRQEHVASRRAK